MRHSAAAPICVLLSSWMPAAQPPAYRDPTVPIDARVRDLLGRLTIEETFWQLS